MSSLASLVGVRPGEGRVVGPALGLAFFCVGAVGLATIASDTLLVSAFDLGAVSRFYVVASAVRVAVAFGYAGLARRFAGARFDAAVMLCAAALMIASAPFARGAGGPLLYGVCVAQIVLPPLLPLVAFNAVMDCFHARQAKRLLPLVAAAATLGSIATGAGATLLSTTVGMPGLLVAGAVLSLAAARIPSILALSLRGVVADPSERAGKGRERERPPRDARRHRPRSARGPGRARRRRARAARRRRDELRRLRLQGLAQGALRSRRDGRVPRDVRRRVERARCSCSSSSSRADSSDDSGCARRSARCRRRSSPSVPRSR